MKVSPEDIQVIARLVDDLSGISLDESKGYLIEHRLSTVAEEAGCNSFSELYHRARYDNERELQAKIVDAITTNETLFFRDMSPFHALQHKALPETIDARGKTTQPRRLRIWSAACSTGQEPYSIAMTICELIPDADQWDISILATDISDAAIAQASRGSYAEFEIKRGMEDRLLNRYFTKDGTTWKVHDRLRSMVSFHRINLMDPFTGMGPFDIVFCRNVAIYFQPDVQAALFNRVADQLTPEGYLFVGSSESLMRLGPRFAPQDHCRAVYYRPNLPPKAAA